MIQQTAPDTTDEVEELLVEEDLTAEEISTIKKKSVSGVMSYFLRTAFLQGVGLVSAFILSAYLSQEDFGIYGFVIQIIGLLIFFSDVGLASALIRKKDKPSLKDYRTAFTVQQLLSWLIVGVILVIIFCFDTVQNKTGQTGVWILLSLAFSFPLASFKTVSSIKLQRDLDFSKLVVPQIFEQIVFHGSLIFLAYRGLGALAYAWAILLRSIVGTIVMWILKPWKISILIDKSSLKSLLKFGVKFQLNDFLARIKDQLYFLALGMFFPLNQFGIIQWAKNWSMYPYNLTVNSVMAITFPTFSRLQAHKNLLKKAIEKSLFFISASIFPILALMSVFIFPLTEVIEKYHKWQDARFSFVLFTLSIAWAALSTPLVNTLNAIGQINKSLRLMVVWTVLTWVLTPIMIYLLGFNGVAASAFLISFTSVLSIRFVNKVVKIDVWGNINKQLIAVIVMSVIGVVGLNYWSQSLVNMFMGMILVSLAYLLFFFAIAKDKIISEVKSLKK